MSHPCHTRRCPGRSRRRGLCEACYSACKRQVQNGATTWAKLERDGHCLKPSLPPRLALLGLPSPRSRPKRRRS